MPANMSMTLRLWYLPIPTSTWIEPSRANSEAHSFSVQEMSAWLTVAKVSGVWWHSSSSAGTIFCIDWRTWCLPEVSSADRGERAGHVVGHQGGAEDRGGGVVVVQRVGVQRGGVRR